MKSERTKVTRLDRHRNIPFRLNATRTHHQSIILPGDTYEEIWFELEIFENDVTCDKRGVEMDRFLPREEI